MKYEYSHITMQITSQNGEQINAHPATGYDIARLLSKQAADAEKLQEKNDELRKELTESRSISESFKGRLNKWVGDAKILEKENGILREKLEQSRSGRIDLGTAVDTIKKHKAILQGELVKVKGERDTLIKAIGRLVEL